MPLNFIVRKKMADPITMSASELGEALENNRSDPVETLDAFFDVKKNTH